MSCLVILFFCLSGSLILAQSNESNPSRFSEFEKFVKKDIGVYVKVYEKDEISQKGEKQLNRYLLNEKLVKYNVKDGVVTSIKKEQIPDNMQILSFNNEDDAAKYIAYNEIVPINEQIAYSTSLYTYTRNYKVYVEGFLTRWIDINTIGTFSTNDYGYSTFSYVQKPWFTFNGLTTGTEMVTNSTWKSILNGGLKAQIGGSYTKKQYLLINGILQLYSVTKNTTKTITPTGN